jgi:hypothetical protein
MIRFAKTVLSVVGGLVLLLSAHLAEVPAVRPSKPKLDHRLELTQALERRWFDRDPLAVLFRSPD